VYSPTFLLGAKLLLWWLLGVEGFMETNIEISGVSGVERSHR
jgi:hypothetical protein